MLRELFEAMSQQAVLASGNALRVVDGHDPTKQILIGQDGQEILVDRGLPPRRFIAYDLASFIALCDQHCQVAVFLQEDCDGLICQGIFDWDNRGGVAMRLEWHPLFAQFFNDDGDRILSFDQREMVRWLAQDMRKYVNPSLTAIFRQVSQTAQGSNQVAGPGRERGTREFCVEAAGELPETFTVEIPLVAHGELVCFYELTLGLDVTLPPQPVTFKIRPLCGEIDLARRNALQCLQASIGVNVTDHTDGTMPDRWADRVFLGAAPRGPVKLP